MDFTNRGQQQNSRPTNPFNPGSRPEEPNQKPKPEHSVTKTITESKSKWLRWGGGAIVIIVAVLIAAVLALFIGFKPASEAELIDTDKLQAVFLTNDQVYFGDITSINNKYLVLSNIYYLQSSSKTSANKTTSGDVSLIKLGCELHKPQDHMVISQDQVSFWENLTNDGQVANAVKQYEKANPKGQNCDTANPQSNPVQGSATKETSTNNTSPTPAANTTPTKATPSTDATTTNP